MRLGSETSLKLANYTQSKTGRLRTELGGASSFGSLAVSGTATVAGALEIAPINSFKAAKGQKFAIFTASSRLGKFDFVKGAVIGGGLYYAQVPVAGGLTLEATEGVSEGLPAESSPPTISGTAKQGQTLVLSHGSWTHGALEYADGWLRCDKTGSNCQATGSTGQSYLLTNKDVGQTLRVQEIASNTAGESAPRRLSCLGHGRRTPAQSCRRGERLDDCWHGGRIRRLGEHASL